MQRIFPFLEWLSNYRKVYFLKDLSAGITVGIVLVPQGMAYAMVAGLPPVYGLYASIFPILVYTLLGTSRKIAVGPVAMDSLLVAAGLGTLAISGLENYIALVIVLTFMVGAFQFILGSFRMGFLVNFLSRPVISGFTSAAALIIIFSQLKHLLGTSIEGSNRFHELIVNALEKLGDTNPLDLAIGLLGIFMLIGFKKWNKSIPGILIIVVLGILGVLAFGWSEEQLRLVGTVPQGLPHFVMPNLEVENLKQLWPIAIALALVGYLEAISIGKSLEEKSGEETIRPNQELIALGSANIVGSFFQAFPVTASFSRSAINYESGAKTNLASFFSILLVLLTVLFLTPLFQYLPNAILASIIMVSVYGLIDFNYSKNLWNTKRDEFFVLLITFITTLFVGITEGILVGVLASLLLMVYRTSRPHFAVLGNIKNSDYYKNIKRFGDEAMIRDDLLIIRFDAQLYFGNATFFKKELMHHIKAKGKTLKGVILNAEAINYIDASGVQVLTQVIHEIHEKGLQFYIAGAIGPTRDTIFNSGIINELHMEYLFVKTKEAVAFFDNPDSISEIGARVAYENNKKNDRSHNVK
ncbi:SulP family inorganic anion transporter [Maribacter sp. 2210JD10-5]|uniref:SulP family inorganic anion transporter n=1 Tax=Maribacter sp. 2210JD10-5 TaxID=3386272 RepID=UPI0039BC5331